MDCGLVYACGDLDPRMHAAIADVLLLLDMHRGAQGSKIALDERSRHAIRENDSRCQTHEDSALNTQSQ